MTLGVWYKSGSYSNIIDNFASGKTQTANPVYEVDKSLEIQLHDKHSLSKCMRKEWLPVD